MSLLPFETYQGRQIIQIAFSVDNLEQAALHWARTFGAGPFFVYEALTLDEVRGPNHEPGVFELGAAFGQWGAVMVEFVNMRRVEPAASAPALMQRGFHHIAYFSADSAAEVERLEASGAPVLMRLGFAGVPVHFHDGRATAGFVIEHYPCVGPIEELYRKVAEAAKGWDGRDPVRGPLA